METIQHLIDSNKKWADEIKKDNPDFFSELAKGQSPDYLWIGCSDSRVPATQLMGLSPGDVFVHRNIANMVIHSDLNAQSVIQYAVDALQVKHVIICGHYGCGGVKAALGAQENGMIDHWLDHIRDVGHDHEDELETLSEQETHDRLCELNVLEQVKNISRTPTVQAAWDQGADLTVHGLIYNLEEGTLKDLK